MTIRRPTLKPIYFRPVIPVERPVVKIESAPPTPPPKESPSELVDLLREMKKVSVSVAEVLAKPEPSPSLQLAPVVHVAPPAVNLSPQIQVQQHKRWRFTVTRRDNTAQQRIQEIIVDTLE